MKANSRFTGQTAEFWAHVRTISQETGYTDRKTKAVRIASLAEVQTAFQRLDLSIAHIASDDNQLTKFGKTLFDYFTFRSQVLDNVQGWLMKKAEAQAEFKRLKTKLKPKCALPLNKQKGAKKNHAFLTGIVNMLVEANIDGAPCDYDPLSLTTMTHDSMPLRTLARRVDGAFPSVVNPIAIWEIKEYYYTTTFGSRVADGVYETLLDGLELQELEAAAGRKVHHLLVIDDHFTWWQCGRSYLCRMIDMLHMGYVDEIIFGREVLTALPSLVAGWKKAFDDLSPQMKKEAEDRIAHKKARSSNVLKKRKKKRTLKK